MGLVGESRRVIESRDDDDGDIVGILEAFCALDRRMTDQMFGKGE